VGKRRLAKIHLSNGLSIARARSQNGINDKIYHQRHREYGPMLDQAERLKGLLADEELVKTIPREAASSNSDPGASAPGGPTGHGPLGSVEASGVVEDQLEQQVARCAGGVGPHVPVAVHVVIPSGLVPEPVVG